MQESTAGNIEEQQRKGLVGDWHPGSDALRAYDGREKIYVQVRVRRESHDTQQKK